MSEFICDISARVIVNIASLKLRKQEIEGLLEKIAKVKEEKK